MDCDCAVHAPGYLPLYDYFTPPFFQLTHASAPHLLHIWNPLSIFLLIAACCVVWLGFWALVNTKRFKKAHVAAQPAALEISEHANHLGLNQEEIERWRTYRIAVVHFDADSRIANVSQYDVASAKAVATG
jgi:poly-beta-1,6-N-acetyl-D-glucosamine biosynthesis protein PgaD